MRANNMPAALNYCIFISEREKRLQFLENFCKLTMKLWCAVRNIITGEAQTTVEGLFNQA